MPKPPKAKAAKKPKDTGPSHLIAVHNLSAGNLAHASELGGLAAPSLALVHPEHGMDSFGEISLVAPPHMVDPERGTPVFAADAYTPRHPRAEYKYNDKKLMAFRNWLSPYTEKTDGYTGDLHEHIKKEGTAGLADAPRVKHALMAAFLAEHGKPVEPVMKVAEPDSRYPYAHEPALQEFRATVGDEPDVGFDDPARKEWLHKFSKAARASIDSYAKKMAQATGDPDDEEYFRNSFAKRHFDPDEGPDGPMVYGHVSGAWRASGTKDKVELDKYATQDKVEDAFRAHFGVPPRYTGRQNENGVPEHTDLTPAQQQAKAAAEKALHAWTAQKTAGIQGEPYIPKYSEYSGNMRRIPYNLENILKEMTRKIRGGENFNYGLGNARAMGAKKFRSLDDIRKARSMVVSKEQFDKVKEQSDARFAELENELGKYHVEAGGYHGGSTADSLAQAIGDSYTRGKYLYKELEANGFKGVPDHLRRKIADFATDLISMPTEYFEAKPQRAVGLNEFQGAAVPHDATPETLELLRRHGINHIETYQKGDPKARAAAVHRIARAKDLMLSEEQATALEKAELAKAWEAPWTEENHPPKGRLGDPAHPDLVRARQTNNDSAWRRIYFREYRTHGDHERAAAQATQESGLADDPTKLGHFYRGIDQPEHDYIVQHGNIRSNESACLSGEGTCFGRDYGTAKIYAMGGSRDPATTGTKYVLEVAPGADIRHDPRDDYHKTLNPNVGVPAARITRVWRFQRRDQPEEGTWGPQGFTPKAGDVGKAEPRTIESLPHLEDEEWPADQPGGPPGGGPIRWRQLPFPYRRKPVLAGGDDRAARAGAKVEQIPFAAINGSQRRTTEHGVKKYLEHPPGPDGLPTVYAEPDGRFTVADGHHRLTAAYLRGGDTTPAVVIRSPLIKSSGVVELPDGSGFSVGTVGKAEYPVADPPEYANSDYRARGGAIVRMAPDVFLRAAKPLVMDDEVQDNVDSLAQHVQGGGRLDPGLLVLHGGQVVSHDGRHRALMAKKLGMGHFPVLVMNRDNTPVDPNGLAAVVGQQGQPIGKAEDLDKSTPEGLRTLEMLRPRYEANANTFPQSEYYRRLKAREAEGDVMFPEQQQAYEAAGDAPITVNFPGERLADIDREGALRNFFDTGATQGNEGREWRKTVEEQVLGIPRDTPAGRRPLYAALHVFHRSQDPVKRLSGGARQYGDMHFVLKPDVMDRSTVTPGDSMALASNVPAEASGHVFPASARQHAAWIGMHRGEPYIEAQVHGGVDLDRDVAALHYVPRGVKTNPEKVEAAREFAKRRGIPAYMHEWKRDADNPMHGDYVTTQLHDPEGGEGATKTKGARKCKTCKKAL